MTYGKAIELFFVGGTADGLVTAELSNWNGKAIRIPRTEVEACAREDIREIGVYFLLCQEDDGSESVYIGEAENIYERLVQHLRDYQRGREPYYWNTAIAFTGRDLNKASIRFLENRFVETARACGRMRVLTKNSYKRTVMKESQIASMEEFGDNVEVVLSALGCRVLVPTPKPSEKTVYLYCKNRGTASAKGFVSSGGFTVLAGSTLSDSIAPSMETQATSYFKLRKMLEDSGIVEGGAFVQNYEFSAPSAASSVVLGCSSNGKADWKSADGTRLKDL